MELLRELQRLQMLFPSHSGHYITPLNNCLHEASQEAIYHFTCSARDMPLM